MSIARLVAEVRYGPTAHIRATKIGQAYWFRVRVGKKRLLHCDCGASMKYFPNAIDYDPDWGGCSHIVALFKGNVTKDERDVNADYNVTFKTGDSIHFARLTKLGEEMFWWRWVALKL